MLIGRGGDVRVVTALIAGADLVTLVGPGGIGKTALARACVAELRDHFSNPVTIELGQLDDSADLDVAVAEAMGLPLRRSAVVLEDVRARFAVAPQLYFFDAAEHVDDAVRALLADLTLADGSAVLVTSRRPLNLPREVTFNVSPLSRDDAAALYVRRRPDADATAAYAAVAELDGLPLAVELAAASGEASTTFVDSVARSVALVSSAAAELLETLTAYPAGLRGDELDDAALRELIELSLVTPITSTQRPRYRLLDPVRDALGSGLDDARRAELHEQRWRRYVDETADVRDAFYAASEADAITRLAEEMPNIRAALWSSFDSHVADGVPMLVALSRAWTLSGNLVDAERWLLRALPVAGEHEANIRIRLGLTLQQQGRFAEAVDHLVFGEGVARRAGDRTALAAALLGLGQNVVVDRQMEQAETNLREAIAIADEADAAEVRILARFALGSTMRLFGRIVPALEATEDALAVARALGSKRGEAISLSQLGGILATMGQRERARAALEQGRELARELGFLSALMSTTGTLGAMAMEDGDSATARALLTEALRLATESAQAGNVMVTRLNLAITDLEDDKLVAAREHAGEVRTLAGQLGQARLEAEADAIIGQIDAREGDRVGSLAAHRRALATRVEIGDARGVAVSLDLVARVVADGDPVRGAQLLGAAAKAWEDISGERAPEVEVSTREVRRLANESVGPAEAQRFEAVGASLGIERAVALALDQSAPVAEIRTLGDFAVLVEGELVPAKAFGGKKARDLVKILVCRRGELITREQVCELLWPNETPDATRPRLRVALAGARRAFGASDVVCAVGETLSLDLARVGVDVERMLGAAGRGQWAEVEALYRGDFLPEDVYDEWSVSLRDTVRRTYVRACHELRADADAERVVVLTGRILELDPYDDGAHAAQVTALEQLGRHGEAERSRAEWQARLDDLDVS